MVSPTDRLTVTEVAALAGIAPSTFRAYRVPRYEGGPTYAPEPDGHLDRRTPYWLRSTVDAWIASRPGK